MSPRPAIVVSAVFALAEMCGTAHAAAPALHLGAAVGTAIPLAPGDFGRGWRESNGYGAFARVDLSARTTLVLRVERYDFAFDAARYETGFRPGLTIDATGSDATIIPVTLGLGARQGTGTLRAHATLCAGAAQRFGRRAQVTDQSHPYEIGEPDDTKACAGFDVGLDVHLAALPTFTVELSSLWLDGGEMIAPLRAGIVWP